jgi:hypothetical protein
LKPSTSAARMPTRPRCASVRWAIGRAPDAAGPRRPHRRRQEEVEILAYAPFCLERVEPREGEGLSETSSDRQQDEGVLGLLQEAEGRAVDGHPVVGADAEARIDLERRPAHAAAPAQRTSEDGVMRSRRTDWSARDRMRRRTAR